MTDQNQPYSGSAPPNSTMAIISLVAGILGWTFLPGIASIAAVITGNMAKKEIQESNGTLGGEGLATAGVVLGWAGIAVGVLAICCFAIFFILPFLGIAITEFSYTPGLLPLF